MWQRLAISSIIIIVLFDADYVTAQKRSDVELDDIISSRRVELEAIKKELKLKEERVKILEAEEKQYLKRLYAIEEQLSLNNRFITKIKKQITDLNNSLKRLESRLAVNQEELKRREDIMEQRLVWIYKRSNFSPLLYAIGAEDFLQGARRLYLFSLLNRYDRSMIIKMEELNQSIKSEKSELLKRKNEIINLKAEKETQAKIVKVARKNRKRLLMEIRRKKDVQLKEIQQLVEDQERISGIIEILMAKKTASEIEEARAFLKLQGKLLWPVTGKIIRGFGKIRDEKYATVISNPGIDIEADMGSPVRAIATGEVTYISWLRGYGSFVIIDHGGSYYSLYAHLDEILVEIGQLITAGEILGTVSETGASAKPVLHFELRKGKEQLNPAAWLR
ncbi:MAG: hypothetical protein B6D58_07170 [candidate division Zixibacteria bacterium 4484_95]|nr:MAG: hypothetical protein B6D58_07170 [candidate division Zixibacteria bacterium 4484_95]